MSRPVFLAAIGFTLLSAGFAPRVAAQPAQFYLETVDVTGDVGTSASIAVDAAGKPSIVSVISNPFEDDLSYSRREPSGWSTDAIPIEGQWEMTCGLALDSRANPTILYSDYLGYAATPENGAWRFQNVGGCPGPYSAAIAAGPDGARVCLTSSCSGGIYYGLIELDSQTASGWEQEVVETRVDNFAIQGDGAIAVDADGNSHLSVSNLNTGALRYFRKVNGAWQIETIGHGNHSSIAVDRKGVPHVTFYDPAQHRLKLGVRTAGGWEVGDVDAASDAGQRSALKISEEGTIHVAYYDVTNGDLVYSHRRQGDADWTRQVVDATGDVGRWLSLALDTEGHVHIAYYDATDGDLEYATTRPPVTTPAPAAVRPVAWSGAKAAYRDPHR